MNLLVQGDGYDVSEMPSDIEGIECKGVMIKQHRKFNPYSPFGSCVSQYLTTLKLMNSMQKF